MQVAATKATPCTGASAIEANFSRLAGGAVGLGVGHEVDVVAGGGDEEVAVRQRRQLARLADGGDGLEAKPAGSVSPAVATGVMPGVDVVATEPLHCAGAGVPRSTGIAGPPLLLLPQPSAASAANGQTQMRCSRVMRIVYALRASP